MVGKVHLTFFAYIPAVTGVTLFNICSRLAKVAAMWSLYERISKANKLLHLTILR